MVYSGFAWQAVNMALQCASLFDKSLLAWLLLHTELSPSHRVVTEFPCFAFSSRCWGVYGYLYC
jgi:hypothetical protein